VTRFSLVRTVVAPLTVVLASALAPGGTARAQGDRAAWVRANAVPIADQSPDAALARIAVALDGVNVVLLGESSHGDGGGHLARVRLVRYLHEYLGFDVIAWEAGVREAVAFDSLLGTSAPLGAIAPLALYPWWAESAELRPMLEYIRGTRRTRRPLTFAGFDIQRSGPLDSLVSYLTRSFDRSGDPRLFPPTLRDTLTRGFARMASLSGDARDSVEQTLEAVLHAAAPDLERRFSSARPALANALGAEADVVGRVLANVIANAEQLRLAREPDEARRMAANVASYNLRERRNAENILWLLRHRYPGRKLIVWLHNVHAINAHLAPRFDALALDDTENRRDATARVLRDSLGDRSYAVAMLSFDGAWAFPGQRRTELPPAPAGSLAALLHETGFPRAFLDLRARGRSLPAWLSEPMIGTVNTQTPARYPVIWPRVADGVLFVDRMTPSTKASQ
jgi:erythromycin esterase